MIQEVNIYLLTTIRGPREQEGHGIYLLECITERGPVTVSGIVPVTAPENQAEVITMLAALKRLRQQCNLTLFTDNNYLARAIEHYLPKWKENGFVTSKGEPVKEEWKEIAEILNGKPIQCEVKTQHSYKNWLRRELMKEV